MESILVTTTTLIRSGENLGITITYSGGDRPLSDQGYILTKKLEPISRKDRSGALVRTREDISLVVNEDFSAGWETSWSTSNDLLLDDEVIFTEIENGLRIECTGTGDSSFFYLFLSDNSYLDSLFMGQTSGNVVIRVTGKFLTTTAGRFLDILVCRPTTLEPYSFKVEGEVRKVYTGDGIEKSIAEIMNRELTGVLYNEFEGSTVAIRFRLNVPLIFEIHTIKVNTNE